MLNGEPGSGEIQRSASRDGAGSTAGQPYAGPGGPSGIFDLILIGMAAKGHVFEAISPSICGFR
jgi:hypothetical protein